MKVLFKYNEQKDAENFLKATRSKNNAHYTQLALAYIEKYGENVEKEQVQDFLQLYRKENGIDPEKIKNDIEQRWRKIENNYVNRTEKLFDIEYPADSITAFLTTESRCTYNIDENYFFVSMQYPEKSNWIIMHELLHFYTRLRFYDDLLERGVDDSKYNAIKESLTVLLNEEYADVMDGEVDSGYPQHQELREFILTKWREVEDLEKVIDSALYKM